MRWSDIRPRGLRLYRLVFDNRDSCYRRTTHGLHRMSIYVDDPDGYHIELTVVFDDPDVGRREIAKRGLLAEAGRQS
jgi:hypothetical protein